MSATRFDAAYYQRFYGSPKTRVQGPREVAHLASGIVRIIEWLGAPIDSVLDVGAGAGLWRDWFRKHRKDVAYRSVDASAYACTQYGHERRDIGQWRARGRFDLVVCQGVLPYLADAEAEAAIGNLGAMTGGFLYLEAATRQDFAAVCDREATDPTMLRRSGAWYRTRLERHFAMLAFGLWMSRRVSLPLYELERGR
jgi:hypothetical protein